MLPAGKLDFLMTGNLLQTFDNVKNGVPTVVVAAIFQKDPQACSRTPNQGYASSRTWPRRRWCSSARTASSASGSG
jgi:ABC-type nitrate/sulfonate/bicarbonate transport system substrate-binding protein